MKSSISGILIVFMTMMLIHVAVASISVHAEEFTIYSLPMVRNVAGVLAVDERTLIVAVQSPTNSFIEVVELSAFTKLIMHRSYVVDRFVVKGAIASLTKSAIYRPNFIAVASRKGEVLILDTRALPVIDVKRMRFAGISGISKIEVTDSGFVLVQASNELWILHYGSERMCVVGASRGNALVSGAPMKVIDFASAITSDAVKGLKKLNLIAIVYQKVPIPKENTSIIIVSLEIVNGNRTVPAAFAIVKIRYDNRTDIIRADSRGIARIVVPSNVSLVTIEGFYANKTTGMTYYGMYVLRGPLEPQSTYFVKLELVPMRVAVPSYTAKAYLRIVKLQSIDRCVEDVEKPIIEMPILTLNPNAVRIHVLYTSKLVAIAVLSYPLYTQMRGLSWAIDIIALDLATKNILDRTKLLVDTPIVSAAISEDGKVMAVSLSNGIIYVMKHGPKSFKYEVVGSYVLESPAYRIEIFYVPSIDGYVVLCSEKSEFFEALAIGGRIGFLKPIGRKIDIGLELPDKPTYVDALPGLKLITIASPSIVLFARDMGSNIAALIGKDLSLYIAKSLALTIIGPSGTMIASNVSISASPQVTVFAVNGSIELHGIGFGTYRIDIVPVPNDIPELRMVLKVGAKSVTLGIELIDRVTRSNTSLTISRIEVSSGDVRKVIEVNATYVELLLNMSRKYEIVLHLAPLTIRAGATIYRIKAYDNATLLIDLSKGIDIRVLLPRWKRANTFVVCVRDEYGRSINDAYVTLLGAATGYSAHMNYSNALRCFTATNIPFDVYNLSILLPQRFEPLAPRAVAVANSSVKYTVIAHYRPVSLTLVFNPIPKTNLLVKVGARSIIVNSGCKCVTIHNLAPGTYTVIVKGLPTVKTFGNKTISIYAEAAIVVQLSKNETVVVPLKETYKPVKIVLIDTLSRGAPLGELELYIDGKRWAVIKANAISRPLVISGYIPTKTFELVIVSKQGIYSKYSAKINGSAVKDSLIVRLKRVLVPITLNVYSNLGEALDSAIVNVNCSPPFTSSVSTVEGTARLYIPAYSSCMLTVFRPGYTAYETTIFVDTSPKSITVVLSAQPLTIVMKYLPLIVSVVIVCGVVGSLLYLRKRILSGLIIKEEELF